LIQSQRTVIEQSAFESNKCGDNFTQSSAHIVCQKTQTGRDKFCEYNGCTNIFYQKLDLTINQRTHTEEKFCCSGEYGRCRKYFHQKAHLIRYQRTHSGEKLECEERGKSFCTSSHSIQHSGAYVGFKLYECNECGKTFCQKSNLSEHVRIHIKEKTYGNNDCGKS
ncbi:zinc finger protein 658B-like, partial [Carlito syrichta]|uniref:Zinc finger protein 658B-like n=1 Tax=Carlito syrichta TaxID=1868482 RepID=A0A3Q0EFT9_CARSF